MLNSSLGYEDGIRRGIWNRHPVKLKYIKANRKLIDNPNPKGKKAQVFGGTCTLCHKDFVMKDLQVDHIDGGDYSLRTLEDVQSFFESISVVVLADLRFLCVHCNSTCTYAKRFGYTYEQAFAIKYIISLIKDKKIDGFFTERGFSIPKTVVAKREKAVKIVLDELKNNE